MGRRSVRGIEAPKAFSTSEQAEAWVAGYEHGKAQCNHHPEALTADDHNDGIASALAVERRVHVGKQAKAFSEGHDQGRRDEMNDKYLTTPALRREFERGKNYGFTEAHEAGVKEGHEQTAKHANQWLMEAFVLFMQEQGAEAAAMTLGQMHALRHAVNMVDAELAAIEEPR